MTMKKFVLAVALAFALGAGMSASAEEAASPFLGDWALTLFGGGAGWLSVTQEAGYLDGGLLWGGGSVNPVESMYIDGDKLVVTMARDVERKDAAGKVVRKQNFTDTLTMTVSGDTLQGVRTSPKANGKGVDQAPFNGKRIPALPAKPDLSKVKYGHATKLLNGKNLAGWVLTDPHATSGWSVEKGGILTNNPEQKEGQPHISYGNLRTVKEFEDFNIKLEVNVPQGGNSGVYLRGIYEVQVVDSFGKPLDPHNMGAIYSRITPLLAAEKPAGQWQTLDITLIDRHVTVKLNDKLVIDNEPLRGCTGGALWSDQFKPGPIYLQGDHTGVKYRNIVLRPVVKK
jgi:hypothetical protein